MEADMVITLRLYCSCGSKRKLEIGECVKRAFVADFKRSHKGTGHAVTHTAKPLIPASAKAT
jgi:hypothetical protein